MISRLQELQLVSEGRSSIVEENASIYNMHLEVEVEVEPHDILARIKDVLALVLSYDSTNWPSSEEWHAILPQWFVSKFTPMPQDGSVETVQGWILEGWVPWFHPEDTDRQWRWVDSEVKDTNTIVIRLAVEGWPVAVEALHWLCFAAGATKIS